MANKKNFITCDGNHAASHVAYMFSEIAAIALVNIDDLAALRLQANSHRLQLRRQTRALITVNYPVAVFLVGLAGLGTAAFHPRAMMAVYSVSGTTAVFRLYLDHADLLDNDIECGGTDCDDSDASIHPGADVHC